MPFAPRVLNDEALQGLGLSADEIVTAIEEALRAAAGGRLISTPKSVIQPGDGRYMMTTLATGGVPDVTVVKAVTVCPDNPARGLPSITGAIMVLDAQTGECLALMDAEWITGVRTAGLSAVAARRMADPGAATIGFVGCGVQARSHLELLCGLFPLRRIKAFGRGPANIDRLCHLAQSMGLQAHVCSEADEALEDADIVVSSITITYDGAPFLDAARMKPGALAVVTDAAKPWQRESFAAFGTIVVDDTEQELASPAPVATADRIAGDLTDLVQDKIACAPGPRAFMFRGLAAGDHALAATVWNRIAPEPG